MTASDTGNGHRCQFQVSLVVRRPIARSKLPSAVAVALTAPLLLFARRGSQVGQATVERRVVGGRTCATSHNPAQPVERITAH